MGIVNNLLRRKPEEAPPEEQPKVSRRADPPTPLMLLLPDAGGIASYQLNVFPSAKAAEFYLDSTLRGQVPEGAVLFWALSWEPASHPDYTQAEPLVVIRDTRKATVYPFSFADIDSAMEFIRYEMNRGLDLGQVMVFFAVPARIEVDFWGRSTIIPPAAPVRSFQPRAVGQVAAVPIPQAPKPVARVTTPAPEPVRTPAAPTDDTRYLNEDDIAEVVQMAREISAEPVAEVAPADDARVLPMPRRNIASVNGNNAVKADDEPHADPIEFTPAAQKVQEARASLAMIAAWGNFSQAIDEALDVHVAHQVSAKLVWNRLCRALREAMAARQRVRMLACWQALTNAFVGAAEAKRTQEKERAEHAAIAEAKAQAEAAAAEERARAKAAAAAEVAAVQAATREAAEKAASATKAIRRAWLNISWTMEEAAYAHALEQKARAIRGWRFGSLALAEAAEAKIKYDAAMGFAWENAANALHAGAGAYLARRQMFRGVWRTITFELGGAAFAKRRMDGVYRAMHNTGLAIDEALDAKSYRDGMMAACHLLAVEFTAAAYAQLYHEELLHGWSNAGRAFGELCKAYVKKQKRAIKAWGRLSVAFGGVVEARIRLDGYIAACQNATAAIREAVIARARYEAFVEAWSNAGEFFVEVVDAYVSYRTAVRSWTTMSEAILEAVTEKFRRDALVAAWTNASIAIDYAVKTAIARQAAFELTWSLLSDEFVNGAEAQRFYEMSVTAWSNAGEAMAEAGNAYLFQLKSRSAWRNASRALVEAIPLHNVKMAAIESWNNAGIALKEAVVAEAKMRIAQAGLDKTLMADVDKTVREAQKAVKKALKEGKQVAMPAIANVSPAPVFIEVANEVVEEVVVAEPVVVAEEEELIVEEQPVVEFDAELSEEIIELAEDVVEDVIEDDGIDFEPLESEEQGVEAPVGVFGMWRPGTKRWEPREEPFGGFGSPPGRFHRATHEDDTRI